MTKWNKFIERIDHLASDLVIADISVADDLIRILGDLSALRADPEIKDFHHITRTIVSAAAAASSLKTTVPDKAIKILSSLCSTLKAALDCLSRSEDPDAHLKSFEDLMNNILKGPSTHVVSPMPPSQSKDSSCFVASAQVLLDEAEKFLLVLEKVPDDKANIDEVFRVFHTIKGDANLTGVLGVAAVAHEAENLLVGLRSGAIKSDEELTTILLKTVDGLRGLLQAVLTDPFKADLKNAAVFIQQLQAVHARKISKANASAYGGFVPQVPVLDLSSGPDLLMDFTSEAFEHLTNSEKSVLILESTPKDSEAINNIFRAFHTIKGAAGFMDLKDIRMYAHEAETMLDKVRKGTLLFEGRVVELTLCSIDGMRKLITILQEQIANNGAMKGEYPNIGPEITALKEFITPKKAGPLGEILINQGAITETELQEALTIQKEVAPDLKVGEILIATNAVSAKQIQSALDTQKTAAPVETSIKIQLDKLDTLIDLVGEMVITETQVVQSPEIASITSQRFHRNLSDLDRITRNLQKIVMAMRLVPMGPVFQKMVRLVRDLSKKLGKEVTITFSGEDTEIDKNMVELVSDPLMHMVRNSLDHGIEPQAERAAKGKTGGGKIELAAFHKGGNIVIEIRDDGAGLKRDKILQKAIERGLVKEGENLSDAQIFNLIFEPGFSTADKVTDISGRGVGMDVVKKNIDKLRGKVEISSEKDKGSVFSIYLPITLAIIEGIVVRSGNERYVLPINSIVEFVRPVKANQSLVYDKGEMYKVYGKVYPLIYLNRIFNIADEQMKFEDRTICIVESDHSRSCIVVDELLGQQQVVLKNLGDKLRSIKGVSGAAILGDGRVGLILDINSFVSFAVKQSVR